MRAYVLASTGHPFIPAAVKKSIQLPTSTNKRSRDQMQPVEPEDRPSKRLKKLICDAKPDSSVHIIDLTEQVHSTGKEPNVPVKSLKRLRNRTVYVNSDAKKIVQAGFSATFKKTNSPVKFPKLLRSQKQKPIAKLPTISRQSGPGELSEQNKQQRKRLVIRLLGVLNTDDR